MLPGTEQFPSGLSDHSVTQGANIPARDVQYVHIEEADIRRGLAGHLLHHPESMGALNLVSESLSPALIDSRPLIPFRRRLVPAGLHVILDPIVSGRTPNEIEPIFIQIKKNCIANHISIVVAGDKLLGLIDFESS